MTKRLDSGHIYLITNTVNDKKYVGQTWYELSHRWASHKCYNKRGCPYLSKAILKHGADAFTIESLAQFTTQDEADLLETSYISLYRSNDPQLGYNLTGGGQNGRPPMSEETRKKISEARKGIFPSPEARRKMSISQKQKAQNLPEESQKHLETSRAKKRKLTMEQAEQIRQEKKNGATLQELADKYSVSILVIHHIIHNKTYINDYKE